MLGTPAWWRSKCRSAGVTIPQKSCSGENETPCPLPLGIRRGRSNVERWPRPLVGWPGTLVGSGGAARAGAWASPARRSVCAPSAPAAPASRARREIGASVIVHVPFRARSLAPLRGPEKPPDESLRVLIGRPEGRPRPKRVLKDAGAPP